MVKRIVTGSRRWPPQQKHFVWRVLNAAAPGLVIHGGCDEGVDAFAEEWCRLNEVDSLIMRAKWRQTGIALDRSAGHRRNARMLAAHPGVQVLAFPFGVSPGTHGCIRIAVKLQHAVTIYHPHWPARSFTPAEWFAMESPP